MIARHWHPLVIAAAVAALSSACAIDIVDGQVINATGRFERRLAVDGPVELDVRSGSGSIDIRRGRDREVRVVGHIRANRGFLNGISAGNRVKAIEANPPIAQNGNAIRIGDLDNRDLGRNVSISYEVTVPASTRVQSRTGSGSHRIESIQGPVAAHTGSGHIRVGEIAASVTAISGSGSIEVAAAQQGLTARTGSGSVHARGVTGRVEARSSSGRVKVAYSGAGDGEFSTGSGGIEVTGANGRIRAHAGSGSIRVEGNPAGDWAIDTGSGGVSLLLPPDAAFDLRARTGSGSIQTNHPIEIRGAVSKQRIEGQVRGGGPRLDVSASSGSIRLD